MRVGIIGAAAAAMCAAVPGSAAVYTTYTSNQEAIGVGFFRPFNPDWGAVNSLTLQVDAETQREVGLVFDRSPVNGGAFDVSYILNGFVDVSLDTFNGSTITIGQVALSGSGNKQLEPNFDRFATLRFSGHGSALFHLDPASFVSNERYLKLVNRDLGFYNGSLDTSLTSNQSFAVNRAPGRCGGFGDELCNFVRFKLTYDYTPTGAVPEPSTWAMMILGFCAIGFAMRRKTVLRFV